MRYRLNKNVCDECHAMLGAEEGTADMLVSMNLGSGNGYKNNNCKGLVLKMTSPTGEKLSV